MEEVQTLLSVKKHMRTRVVSKEEDTTVTEAAIQMQKHEIDSLLVTKDGKVIGVITEMDIVHKVVANRINPDTVQIGKFKSFPVVHIDSDKSIFEAKKIMREKKVHHLIIEEKNKVVGMLASRDLLK